MASRPIAIGMTVGDYVIVEERTKKVSLIGSFTGMKVGRFPSDATPFSVYAALTDGLGDVTMELVVVRLDTGEEIYNRRHVVRFQDKLSELRFHLRITQCSFPVAGHDQFTLLADGEWLAQRRLRVYLEGECPCPPPSRSRFLSRIPGQAW